MSNQLDASTCDPPLFKVLYPFYLYPSAIFAYINFLEQDLFKLKFQTLIIVHASFFALLACDDNKNDVQNFYPNSGGIADNGIGPSLSDGSAASAATSGSLGLAGISGSVSGDASTATSGSGGSGGLLNATGGVGLNSTGGQPSELDAAVIPQSSVSDLKIEANPKNVLSCFVSWTTDQAATSVVQFGVGGYEWEISDPDSVTNHRVVVIGMRAEQTYKVKALSTNGSASWSAEGSFTTGSLPSTIPVATVTINDTARSQPGWTLMNIQKGDGTTSARSAYPAQAVMYDMEGHPIWYHIDGKSPDIGGAVSTALTDKGVLIGPVQSMNQTTEPPREVDFAGDVVWECTTPSCGKQGLLTHHASKLSNGHYMILRYVTIGSVTSAVYEELDANNQLVWSWDLRDFITPPSNAGAFGDWCHGNAITINIEKNEVYANCRWLGLVKTTYQNPTFQWHLPASYGATGLGNMAFVPATSQYSDTHDPEIHDDGTILFFDNGGWSGMLGPMPNLNYHSRVVEYKIDEVNKTATLVWEFPGNFIVDPWYKNDWYLPFWGDADRLANGNVLVTAGVRDPIKQSRIFEVTKNDGAVVWEFQLPPDYGVFRSDRLSPPPLVRPITP